MKLYFGKKCYFPQGSILSVGNFDGVHLGHQALLAQLKKIAVDKNLPLVILLFEPQPGEFFQGKNAPSRLSSLREKLAMLSHCGVDYVYCLRFNTKIANMSAQTFAEEYIFSLLNAKKIGVGEDFRFGNKREGNIQLLKEMAALRKVAVDIFPAFLINNERVSSTIIRQALSQGNLKKAAVLLGRDYSVYGRVIPGDARGRKWGIPTANVHLKRITTPLTGVFYVHVQRENADIFYGVANLGIRPTLGGTKLVLEIHLFEFNDNLYQERLKVTFLQKLREEIKFSSVEKLIEQINSDIAMARSILYKSKQDGRI